jgi:hypothetical protein
MKPFWPLLERNVQAAFEREVARLKVLIEAEPASWSPPWKPATPCFALRRIKHPLDDQVRAVPSSTKPRSFAP